MAIIHNNNKLLIRIYLKIHFKKKTKKEKPFDVSMTSGHHYQKVRK